MSSTHVNLTRPIVGECESVEMNVINEYLENEIFSFSFFYAILRFLGVSLPRKRVIASLFLTMLCRNPTSDHLIDSISLTK